MFLILIFTRAMLYNPRVFLDEKSGSYNAQWVEIFFLEQYSYFYAPGFSRENATTSFAQITFENLLTQVLKVKNATPLTTSTQEVSEVIFYCKNLFKE